MKYQTKQELFDFLRRAFKNDPALDTFLSKCDGKSLPDEIDELVRVGWGWENPKPDPTDYEYYENEKPYPYIKLCAGEYELAKLLDIKEYLTFDNWAGFHESYYKDIYGKVSKMNIKKAEKQQEKARVELENQIKRYLDIFVGDTGCYLLETGDSSYDYCFYLFTPNSIALDLMETEEEKIAYILS